MKLHTKHLLPAYSIIPLGFFKPLEARSTPTSFMLICTIKSSYILLHDRSVVTSNSLWTFLKLFQHCIISNLNIRLQEWHEPFLPVFPDLAGNRHLQNWLYARFKGGGHLFFSSPFYQTSTSFAQTRQTVRLQKKIMWSCRW